MARDLDFLFNPSSVAIIGASENTRKWGNWISKNLVEGEWKGNVYLVNVKGGMIFGRRTYRSILDVGGPVDLAVIGIPAKFVLDAVKDCVEKDVKVIIVVTAHFGEYSEEGKRLENELLEVARRRGSRIVGPNCIGVYNSSVGLNTTMTSFPRGSFAFITQSGNFGVEVNDSAKRRKLGFSKFISFGNQIDLLIHEYLDYIHGDPDTKVILMYTEGIREGGEFLKVAKQVTKNKPIVAIKPGVSSAGARAAVSHTGSLCGSNEVYAAAFKQTGIIRVDDSSDLLDVGEALAKCPLPKGDRIAILTNGGGTGTMAADAAERYNLSVPLLSIETQKKMNEVVLDGAMHSIKNPVDFADDMDIRAFERLPEVLLADEGIDGLVIAGAYGCYADFMRVGKLWEEMAYKISKLPEKYGKPIIVHSVGYEDKLTSLQIFSEHGIPTYGKVETAMRCMSFLVERWKYLDGLKEERKEKRVSLPPHRISRVKTIISKVTDAGKVNVVETEARRILREYDLPVSNFKLARSKDEAIKIAKEIGYPVVIKIVSPDIIHKSDAGGVKLDIRNEESVVKAFTEIIDNVKTHSRNAQICGVLITPMEDKGTEVIVGMTTDQTFGPTVMFGLGGIFVEVLKDVSFRVAPVAKSDAYHMIREIKGFPILQGIRGQKPVDIGIIADTIMKVSMLVTENREIKEMDLNPVFVFEKGASVADVRIVLSSQRTESKLCGSTKH